MPPAPQFVAAPAGPTQSHEKELFTPTGKAAISGWFNIQPPTTPPPIWAVVEKHHANTVELPQLLIKKIDETAFNMRMEITTIQLTDDMLKDIFKLDFAPGGNKPVWQNMQRGICILNCLPKLVTQVATDKRREDD